jgi:signal transduction histidine kinase
VNPGESSATTLRELLHEIRTPLAALSALAPAVEEHSRDVYLSILEHLSGILHRSLECAEPGCDPAAAAVVQLRSVIGDAVRLIGVGGRHERFVVAGIDGLDVRADRVLATQILVNLLANALRHSPVGDPIEIRAFRDGAGIAIEVRDRGAGVPAPLVERVFDHGASYGNHDGDGIGLALSRRLAERMQGSLRLANDDGAVFTLVLPAA